jgi:hypothetical protein
MNTFVWLDLILGIPMLCFICFDVGVTVGRRQAERERSGRLKSMRNHPSNHLRSVRDTTPQENA